MLISHSQLTISGPFRELSRARLEVTALGHDQILIRSVSPKFTHEWCLAGEHLDELREALTAAALERSQAVEANDRLGDVIERAS